METSERTESKNKIPLIIGGVLILLCCCAVAVVAGVYSFMNITSRTQLPVNEFEPYVVTVEGVDESPVQAGGIGVPPVGGLGNEILKNDTWQVMVPVAIGLGCDQPIGPDSTIKVLQQPDSNGVWIEQWSVSCRSGEVYDFEVTFILDDTGATYTIRSLD